jgi:hypothetical protein
MQIVFQVLRALAASMAIVDAENLDVRPVRHHRQLVEGVDNVQNDRYPVLIVLTNQANVGVGREGSHGPKALVGYFAVLEIR